MGSKIEMLGKQMSVTMVALLVMAGLGSAALLSYYGQVTASINVQQAISIEGEGCSGNSCSSELEGIGSETAFSDTFSIVSNTENDLKVRFDNSCTPSTVSDCEGITVTNRVLLGIVGFDSGVTDGFEPENYKKSYYEGTSTIDDLDNITYSFNILNNDFSSSNLAPYIVLVSSAFPADVAVSMIPDGNTYNEDEEYVKTVDDDTEFHIPGDGGCTQGSPCTLSDIKTAYDGDITRFIVAVGAWPDASEPEFNVSMGISTINGEQAMHEYVTIFGNLVVPSVVRYDFAEDIESDTYTITTDIVPVTG